MPKTKTLLLNLALMFITIVFVLLFLEIFFRFYFGSNLSYEFTDNTWLLNANQEGIPYPNGNVATINKLGSRGEYDSTKNSILFLGDSFTFGYGLKDNETLNYQIKTILSENYACNLETINAGVPAYGVSQMIQLYDLKYQDDSSEFVVLNIIETDILRQNDDSNFARKSFAKKLISYSSFLSFMKPRLEIFRQLITNEEDSFDNHFEEYLLKDQQRILDFNNQLNEDGKTLILHIWTYGKEKTNFYKTMNDFSTDNNIIILDDNFDEVFMYYYGDVYELYLEDGHPSNIQTSRLAATMSAELYPYIEGECNGKQ
ncbi:MAG: SGNH/GDSL hydrolase family protein [Nanoarchaeota archaeon]|nr:SGNH/GDSL hydrolase family protein [Nanoarchaeota archaeon]